MANHLPVIWPRVVLAQGGRGLASCEDETNPVRGAEVCWGCFKDFGCLVCCFGACGEAGQGGGSMWQRNTSITVAGQPRGRGKEEGSRAPGPLPGAHPNVPIPLLHTQGWPSSMRGQDGEVDVPAPLLLGEEAPRPVTGPLSALAEAFSLRLCPRRPLPFLIAPPGTVSK